MKVLLHNAVTDRYYAGDNQWASDSALAIDLEQVERAAELNEQYRLGATEIILAYERPPCTLRIPISNAQPDPDARP
jgi:hypothetical protein